MMPKATPSSPTPRPRLVMARYQRGWSQQEVADQLGTTPLNVSRWERGLTTPYPYFRQRLTALFAMSESDLDLAPKQAEVSAVPPPAEHQEELVYEALYDLAIPLPAFGLPFIGRSGALTQLRERLLQQQVVALSALNGLPGVGKTALAVALAHDPVVRQEFRDGILWAALGSSPKVQEILSRWGTLLGFSASDASRLSSLQDWARALRGAIGERRLLLVLDDAWQLADVLACQVGGPHCAYLLTTRSPLLAQQVSADQSFAVTELDEQDSLCLLSELAPEALRLEPEAVRTLVHQVGGLPLTLTLLGHQLRLQAYSGQPRRIRAALAELQRSLGRLQMSRVPSLLEAVPAGTSSTISCATGS